LKLTMPARSGTLSSSAGSGFSSLARRIVARELICFEWQGELWLPLLQFDPFNMSLQPAWRK
jgi:hypothetical protein